MAALTADALQTLVIMWVFTWVSMAIMTFRLVMRKVRGQTFELGDHITIAAMFCLMARNGMIHVVFVWGTNNVTEAFRNSHHFTADEIHQREVGSKLTITNRVFYNS